LPATLADSIELQIKEPAALRHLEVDVVLLSLTRSHTHRAVAFARDPKDLVWALTRPRARLILVGDLGTLVRRSQWRGPLEQQDENAANQERELALRLVNYFLDQGRHMPTIQERQASGI
jgi:superfamily I DNA and/or RNA helicase